jgi:FkbM family methyltransferase
LEVGINWRQGVGWVARRLPARRIKVAGWLNRHPGDAQLQYRDTLGLVRTADLRDHIESRWFAGAPLVLPPWVARHIRPGDWVLDVGANVGVLTGQMCRLVGETGRVWAFEPLPRNIARLNELRDLNRLSQLTVFPVALGAADGEADLRLPEPGHSGWASFTADWNTAGKLPTTVRSLDSVIEEAAPPGRVSFVKLDIEGFEFDFLAGAHSTLTVHRPTMYIEFNDPLLVNAGRSSAELLEVCAELGYRPVGPSVDEVTAGVAGRNCNLLLAAP